MAVKHIDKSGIVVRTAKELDALADEKLGLKGSERVQEQIVTQVLLPIARELMKESHERYIAILESEQHGFLGESIRGERFISGEVGEIPKPRQNFGPKL